MKNLAVEKALRDFGHQLQVARRKRRISQEDMANRVGVTRQTIRRMENGDPVVRMEIIAMSLLVLGELPRLTEIMDPASDDTGLLFDEENLPKRIRSAGKPKKEEGEPSPEIGNSEDGLGMGF